MVPILRFIISSESKKKELRCACLSEAKASDALTDISSSAPHFLRMGLLLGPITYKCLLGWCAVRKPVTTLRDTGGIHRILYNHQFIYLFIYLFIPDEKACTTNCSTPTFHSNSNLLHVHYKPTATSFQNYQSVL
jgi:hypothetical protein